MPFGLTNAPATFQRLMERVLAGLQWQVCLVYIDDIIIFSRTIDEHVERIQEVFDRLKKAGLKLKPEKCRLFRKRVRYLGHLVSSEGSKLTPKNKSHRGMGRTNNDHGSTILSRVVLILPQICTRFREYRATPTQTNRKKQPIPMDKGTAGRLGAFEGTTDHAPVLGYPDARAEFILDTDASSYGIGAILSQRKMGKNKYWLTEVGP